MYIAQTTPARVHGDRCRRIDPGPPAADTKTAAPVSWEPNEPLELRVLVDKSVVEVFVNGRQCVAVRVYPGREDSVGVSLRSQGRDAELKSLDAWQMNNIYEPSLR